MVMCVIEHGLRSRTGVDTHTDAYWMGSPLALGHELNQKTNLVEENPGHGPRHFLDLQNQKLSAPLIVALHTAVLVWHCIQENQLCWEAELINAGTALVWRWYYRLELIWDQFFKLKTKLPFQRNAETQGHKTWDSWSFKLTGVRIDLRLQAGYPITPHCRNLTPSHRSGSAGCCPRQETD